MSDKPKSKYSAKSLPLLCGYCGNVSVRALRSAERVLIRCDTCGKRLFAYYVDSVRQCNGETPPESEDPFFTRRVVHILLKDVSPPAQTLYEFIRRYITRYGYAPSLREMQVGVGWASINSVQWHLNQLEAIGLIERDYGAARGIRLRDVA